MKYKSPPIAKAGSTGKPPVYNPRVKTAMKNRGAMNRSIKAMNKRIRGS